MIPSNREDLVRFESAAYGILAALPEDTARVVFDSCLPVLDKVHQRLHHPEREAEAKRDITALLLEMKEGP